MALTRRGQPPAGVIQTGFTSGLYYSGFSPTSYAAAQAAATSSAPAFYTPLWAKSFTNPSIGQDYRYEKTILDDPYEVRIQSATCYVKLWIDQVLMQQLDDDSADPVTVVTELSRETLDATPTLSSTGIYCVPSGFDADDSDTWDTFDWEDILREIPDEPDDPPSGTDKATRLAHYIVLEKFRYSFIVGYEPPYDMSGNNGFP
jgi:hypothetical protein